MHFFTGKINLFDLWICVFTLVINFITLLQKNELKEEHNIILLREGLAQGPYSYQTGSRERRQALQLIEQYATNSRSIRDHLNSILSKFKSKPNKELKASGTEVETAELNALLEEVLPAITEYDIKLSKLDDKKKLE